MYNEPCKTCIYGMDLCDRKDTLQKLKLGWGDGSVVAMLNCSKYIKRIEQKEKV